MFLSFRKGIVSHRRQPSTFVADVSTVKTADYNLCPHREGLGTQRDGGFAKYLIARKENVHKLPENVDFKSAALTEPLACAHHAVSKATIREKDVAVVLGPGPIGLLTAQVAKSQGATVVIAGLSHDKMRLEKAKALGIDWAVNIQEENVEKVVGRLTNGYGADLVFECSGAVKAVKTGLELLRKKRAVRASGDISYSGHFRRF